MSLLFSAPSRLSSQPLQTLNDLSGPLLDSLQNVHVTFVLGSPKLAPAGLCSSSVWASHLHQKAHSLVLVHFPLPLEGLQCTRHGSS